MTRQLLSLLALYTLSTTCCSVADDPGNSEQPAEQAAVEAPPEPLHNLLQVTDEIYCGGEPHRDEAFAELERLGVTTIVSVDGARPDVEGAKRQGLRYVHIPLSYDSIDEMAGRSLARLVRDARGPFYIHCHHGQHRGPAAAAVAGLAAGAVNHREALAILERAGTGRNYTGLWQSVETYQVPADDTSLPELVEVADVGSLTAAMAGIDRAYDHLQLCRDADWTATPRHPDLDPQQQALLLKEGLHESSRHLADRFDPPFRSWLSDAEQVAQQLESALSDGDRATVDETFEMLSTTCTRCHERYRN